ncbi:MAG: cation transporter [Ignavibacteria bacterium]|nr:cation transporter [Ignavibacteria bacterium]
MTAFLSVVFFIHIFSFSCGNKEDKVTEDTKQQSTTQTEKKDVPLKTVEFHTSGMTCTGCENTIKSKVKKVDGVKDVKADYKTGIVRTEFDPSRTNPEAIKEAIISSGYKVEHSH